MPLTLILSKEAHCKNSASANPASDLQLYIHSFIHSFILLLEGLSG